MWNEDTGEEVTCIICEKDYDCKHLLLLFDQTFGECKLGYACDHFNEINDIIEDNFKKVSIAGKGTKYDWGHDALNELWSESLQYSEPDDDYYHIDNGLLYSLIIEMFEQYGGEEYPGLIEDGGGPGCSSSIKLYFAENPKGVFESTVDSFKKMFS